MIDNQPFFLVGTAKGLVVFNKAEGKLPALSAIHFSGFSVNMLFIDERNSRWWAGISHKHWGQKLHYSDDQGITWHNAPIPKFNGELMPNGTPAKLRGLWCMQHGGDDHPGRLWLGTDPGGLFQTNDNGQSWQLVESLWNHPSRQKEGQWFGAGSDFPFIHSIERHPKNSDHLYIAVSCAGVFETRDAGANWVPKNNGLIAAYLPNPNVEVGHDPHKLIICKSNPNILWQQNHCGIFYSKDGGNQWIDVSVRNGIPDYGFSIVIDHSNPAKAWVIPVESDESRIAPNMKMEVYQTNDFGKHWQAVNDGLPNEHVFDIVLRQAFDSGEGGFLFGTTNGNVFFSDSDKISWNLITSHLTKVNVVISS